MSSLTINEGPSGYFTLNGDLNRETIPSVSSHIDCSRIYQAGHNLTLDMAAIEQTDTSGLAWLMNILKQAHGLNLKCDLKDIPKTLVNLAKISDVDQFLSVQ